MKGNKKEIINWLLEQSKEKEFEIKEVRQKRSLNANSYCWVLCQKIAEKLDITKEEVYKKNIREVGKFEIIPIKENAVDTFINAWASKGLGWICEILGESKFRNYKNLIAYYGTSVYDTKEMSNLIKAIIYEAKQLDIETLTPDELIRMGVIEI